MANGMQAYNSSNNNNGAPNSPAPYIKNEPQDDTSRFSNQHQQPFNHPDAYSMSANSHFTQHGGFGDQGFHAGDSIDPSELTVQSGGFMQSFSPYPSNQSVSYLGGGSGVDDDDLRATLEGDQNDPFDLDQQPQHRGNGQDLSFYPDMEGGNKHGNGNGVAAGAQNMDVFSHTPENAPAESPYIRPFPQYRQLYDGPSAGTPSSYNASPIIGSDSTQATNFDHFMNNGKRKTRPGLDRSDRSPSAMSPHTPKTPGIGALTLGAESASLPAQPIQNSHMRQHHKTLSNQWDGTPGSQNSYMDPHSPMASPGLGPHVHPQISDVFKAGGKSLPAKVESMAGSAQYQTQEAKRRRRRESHNMVERRRRDNINERIQELSSLVPHHRLEDEKVRKHLLNSGSLSPTTAGVSGSPPRATSMLAGNGARRASVIANEEKDKGPNKGDILNGAVGWTKDLMWAMHRKLEQENEVQELVARLGGSYPFEQTEEDKRMAAELQAAIAKNGPQNFHYSRAPGSSLRVPGFTDYAGQPLQDSGSERVSPAGSAGKPMQNGGSSRGTPQKYWNDGITFKEEDEYNPMDMS
jgi:hypothetical protein